jgi:hypothetical protein
MQKAIFEGFGGGGSGGVVREVVEKVAMRRRCGLIKLEDSRDEGEG